MSSPQRLVDPNSNTILPAQRLDMLRKIERRSSGSRPG